MAQITITVAVAVVIYFLVPAIFPDNAADLSSIAYNTLGASLLLVWAVSFIFPFVDAIVLASRARDLLIQQRLLPMPLLFPLLLLCVVTGSALCLASIIFTMMNSFIPGLMPNSTWWYVIGGIALSCLIAFGALSALSHSEARWEELRGGSLKTRSQVFAHQERIPRMVIRPFDPGNATEQETLLTLALAQEARLQARMPGLLASPMPEAITTRLREAARLLVVEDASGRAVQPAVWHVKRGSILRAFVAGCNGVAQQLILPDPQESDASAVMGMLLQALEDFWRHQDTDADLLRWPAHDTWFVLLLAGSDFLLDSICATRSLEPFFAVPLVVSTELQLQFRTAQPSDESALLRLFHEELLFHDRSTPFVRSGSAVLQAFQRKAEFKQQIYSCKKSLQAGLTTFTIGLW